MSLSESLINTSEDDIEVSLVNTKEQSQPKALTTNKDLLEALPSKEEVFDHFEKIPKRINGKEYCYCKYCQAENEVNQDFKIQKTQFNADTMLRHLCRCPYFHKEKGIVVKHRNTRSKIETLAHHGSFGGKKPKITSVVERAPVTKTVTVKYSRKTETFDITEKMSAKDVIDSLKEIFDIDEKQKCVLRRESEHKVVLECNNLFMIVMDNEILKLEHAPSRKN